MKNTHIHKLIRLMAMTMAALMISVMQSCKHSHNEPPAPDPPDQPDQPDTTATLSRTILVYMVATNNLGSGGYDTDDLAEMKRAAAAGDIGECKLLAYHASSRGIVLIDILPERVDTIKLYEAGQYSVTIDRMRQVIDDTKAYAPADSYGLVLWSHASGWLQDGIDEGTSPQKSFGVDGFVNGKSMKITSLACALEDADLDFIYFDCCYMGSVETMYELRNCTKYMIGSPAEIPSPGMPYDLNLKHLFNIKEDLESNMVNAATSTFECYNENFVKGDCPNTMVVVKASELDALAKATRKIYLHSGILKDPTVSYQRYRVKYPYYYFDFGQYVESLCDDPSLMEEWKQALQKAVVYAQASPWVWSSFEILHYSGLSTYILEDETSINVQEYNTLSWYADVASALINK